MNQMDEGAGHSDLYIYLIYDYPSAYSTVKIATPYGYVSSLGPCQACINEINAPGLRPPGWAHFCDFCKNYIEFNKLTDYYNMVTRTGKDLNSISEYKFIHFHGKSNVYFQLLAKNLEELDDEPREPEEE